MLTESKFKESEICAALIEEFRRLSHPERAACIALRDAHDCASLLASMAFIQGGISSNEYATAALAALMIRPAFSDSAGDYQNIYAQVRADAMTAQVFVKHMRSEDLELESMIQAGESAEQEFKSSMRVSSEKQSDEATLKLSVLKTVAGFLNAKLGGRLIIGVRDDGSILGIDHDKYQNDDKYILALTNLLSESLGASALDNVAMEIRALREKKVCLINVQPSKKMVFCTYKKKNIDGEVFVRLGPSTRSLKASEVIEFNKTRFGG